MIFLIVKQTLMQFHPRTSLAFSPLLLFHASVQITPTSCTYVLYSLLLCTHPNKMPLLCCLKPPTDYREVVSHTSYLILRSKVTRQDNKSSISPQAATGTSARAGQPRQSLSQCSQLEVCVRFKLSKSDSESWILSTQLPTGQMNDRDLYLPQSWRHFIIR